MTDQQRDVLVRYGSYSRLNLIDVLRKFGMNTIEAAMAAGILDQWHLLCLERDGQPQSGLSNTQRAKRLYRILRKYELVDIMFTGLMGNVWIDRKSKAYRLQDLAYAHLNNIIQHYERREEEVPRAILIEKARRDDER